MDWQYIAGHAYCFNIWQQDLKEEGEMAEIMKDRCRRLCGEFAGNCFTSNNRQVTCLSDMVVNHTYGILSILDMLRAEKDREVVDEYLDEARTISNELINWVKYLQVTQDIRNLINRMNEVENDQRSEIRYPFPDQFRELISLGVDGPGDTYNAAIINFSHSGIRFRYKGPPPGQERLRCSLSSDPRIGKEVSLVCEVRYFAEYEGEMVIGASITEVSDSAEFDFFKNVLEFMNEASSLLMQAA
jgi:hypothetical protein